MEEILAKANMVQWREFERSELLLTKQDVRVYKKRKFFELWKRPTVMLSIDVSFISSVELDPAGRLAIDGIDSTGAAFIELFSFGDYGEAKSIANTLQDMIGNAQEHEEHIQNGSDEPEEIGSDEDDGGEMLGGLPPIEIKVKNVQWQEIDKGQLVLTREEICIYRRRRFFEFWRSPALALRIDTSLVTSVELNHDSRLLIQGVDQNEKSFSDVIAFRHREEASEILSTLQSLLGTTPPHKEQAQREVIEREQREREEREERHLIQQYRRFVWGMTDNIWEIISELRRMIMALAIKDWDTVKVSWQKVEALQEEDGLNLEKNGEASRTAIERQSADEVYKHILALLDSLSTAVESLQHSRADQENLSIKHAVSPRWSQLPYFLLFSLVYTEAMLSYKIEDNRMVSEDVSRLYQLAMILEKEFDLNVGNHIGAFAVALLSQESEQVNRACQGLESYVHKAIGWNAGA